jgi:hypothetical protein
MTVAAHMTKDGLVAHVLRGKKLVFVYMKIQFISMKNPKTYDIHLTDIFQLIISE